MSYRDPELEEQMILRLPPQLADQVRKMLRTKQFNDEIEFEFENDNRTAKFKMGKKKYDAYLVDLPCIVESHKTLDKTIYYKSGDIGQMLVVQDPKEVVPPPSDYKSPNGITPATREIQRRKWRKPPDPAQLREIENEINRLLKPAENETVEILNADDIDDLDELTNTTETIGENSKNETPKIKIKLAEDGNVEHLTASENSNSGVGAIAVKKKKDRSEESRKRREKKKKEKEKKEREEREKEEKEEKEEEEKEKGKEERKDKRKKKKKEKKEGEEDAAVPAANGDKPKKRAPAKKREKKPKGGETIEAPQVPTSPPAAFPFSTITQPPPPLPQPVPSAFSSPLSSSSSKITTPAFNNSLASSTPAPSTPASPPVQEGGKAQLQQQQKKLQAEVDQLNIKMADAQNKYNILPNAVLKARFQSTLDTVREQQEQKAKDLQEVERLLGAMN